MVYCFENSWEVYKNGKYTYKTIFLRDTNSNWFSFARQVSRIQVPGAGYNSRIPPKLANFWYIFTRQGMKKTIRTFAFARSNSRPYQTTNQNKQNIEYTSPNCDFIHPTTALTFHIHAEDPRDRACPHHPINQSSRQQISARIFSFFLHRAKIAQWLQGRASLTCVSHVNFRGAHYWRPAAPGKRVGPGKCTIEAVFAGKKGGRFFSL